MISLPNHRTRSVRPAIGLLGLLALLSCGSNLEATSAEPAVSTEPIVDQGPMAPTTAAILTVPDPTTPTAVESVTAAETPTTTTTEATTTTTSPTTTEATTTTTSPTTTEATTTTKPTTTEPTTTTSPTTTEPTTTTSPTTTEPTTITTSPTTTEPTTTTSDTVTGPSISIIPGPPLSFPIPTIELFPDLAVGAGDDFLTSLGCGQDGCSYRVRFTVGNGGLVASPATSARVRMLNADTRSVPIPSIEAGQTHDVQIKMTGGGCYDPDCSASVVVDPTDRIEESDESNNRFDFFAVG